MYEPNFEINANGEPILPVKLLGEADLRAFLQGEPLGDLVLVDAKDLLAWQRFYTERHRQASVERDSETSE